MNKNLDIKNKRILLIAPHPDDEVIACGGFIAKYHNQIDVLCINSSGVKYNTDSYSAEEIAQIRCNEFKEVMKQANVHDYDITKIWGTPPMIEKIELNIEHYMTRFNFSSYDIILVPHSDDNHIEHKYVGNILLKKILKKQKYKKNLIIMRYELWTPMLFPNYYEDITDFIDDKIRLINLYKSRLPSHYAERILGLNKYRTLTSYFFNSEKFVEAYFIESVKNYMENDKMKIFKKIFSITNEYSNHKKHKVITFFNLKFKFRVKEKRNAQNACGCRERESNPSNCL